MGRKGKRSRSNRGRNATSAPLAPILTQGTARSTHRRVYSQSRLLKLKNQEIVTLSFNLNDIMDATAKSLNDWFEEYKIDRIELILTNVSSDDQFAFNIYAMPELTTQTPSNFAELLRSSGVRMATINASDVKTTTLNYLAKPTFDTTGSANQFRNGFLSTNASGRKAKWYGFNISQDNPSVAVLDLTYIAKVWVTFRGYQ